ncbi:MAG: deoxyribodipyrimidine photo-lyase [Candidatus Omnitrophica bacterium]|nr:deoxyribodipyrimidine photo-lyase [Candidatus Omnitrophota bacterium]
MAEVLFSKAILIFRRDLRLQDNSAFLSAIRSSRQIIPVFILDPRQVAPHPYKSDNAFQFMMESLRELSATLISRGGRLYVFSGLPETVLRRLLSETGADAVFSNRDYTPFSLKRDLAIVRLCESRKIVCRMSDDALLNAPGTVLKQAGGPYTVFTPFFKKASLIRIPLPVEGKGGAFFVAPIAGEKASILKRLPKKVNGCIASCGGRSEALRILRQIKRFKDYARLRDLPVEDGTTRLSAHLKFGTVSVREVYWAVRKALGAEHPLIRQLFWRDFFTTIAYHFPHVFGNAFYPEYDAIRWENDQRLFQAWCEGRTGFPIVDAGMRELNTTGFMHNRVRMIAASFLVKDLHIDWRWGERSFARKLVDYDPAVNNGNWQWAASTGCDHQPYFRIFNPWLQQKRFDPRAVYIKKWVPELGNCGPDQIHSVERNGGALLGYPRPVISHAVGAAWSKQAFREASRRAKSD